MKLLIVNPNTSPAVTEVMRLGVQAAAGPGVEVLAVTASLGASYISSEVSYAIAAHGALDAWARHVEAEGAPDAMLLGCFGDPGVAALREASGLPVVGLAEAAMRQAAEHGRFAIVTGGAAWVPMLERLARGLGLGEALIGVHAVAPSGAELLADRPRAIRLLAEACREAAGGGEEPRSVILGGAALAGMAAEIRALIGLPIIDSVQSGAEMLLRAVRSAEAWAWPNGPSSGGAPWTGLSAELERRLEAGSLKPLLLSDDARTEMDLPPRGAGRRRLP